MIHDESSHSYFPLFLFVPISEFGWERDGGNKEKQPLKVRGKVEMMIIDKVYEAMEGLWLFQW